MKVGFEREWFVQRGKEWVAVPRLLPQDECGYLAEARGEPHADPLKAAYMLLAEERRLKAQARKEKARLVLRDSAELPEKLLAEALLVHGKNPVPRGRGILYSSQFQPYLKMVPRAGLHVHFSNQVVVKTQVVNGFIDIPKIVRTLDERYETDILHAGRRLGEYELKGYGFEYRSLPASTDVLEVADVVVSILSKL